MRIGDVDYNGIINESDARSILLYALDSFEFSNMQCFLADVNGNGTIETADVLALYSIMDDGEDALANVLSDLNLSTFAVT